MPSSEVIIHSIKKRRRTGYITRFFRDLINGDDTGYTLVKAGFILAGFITLTALAVFAPYFLIGGAIFAITYLAVGLKDEYDRNRAEEQKFEQLNKIRQKRTKLLETLKLDQQYSLSNEAKQQLENNQYLLKQQLLIYLNKLQIHSAEQANLNRKEKMKANGHLPNEVKIVRWIERVTGFDSSDPHFASKVYSYLKADDKTDFPETVLATLGYTDYDRNYALNNQKKSRSLRSQSSSVIKHFLTFFWKMNQGMGLILGPAVLLGFFIIGASLAVTWPIVLAAGVVGLIGGFSAIIYNRYVEKNYNKNNLDLDAEINDQNTNLELLESIAKTSQKTYTIQQSHSNIQKHENLQKPVIKPVHPIRQLGRKIGLVLKPDIIAQTFYGMGIGALVGMAIVATSILIAAAALPPVGIPLLVITIPALVVAVIYTARVGYTFGKAAYKSDQALAKKEQSVAHQQAKYARDLANQNSDRQAKTVYNYRLAAKQDVVKDLIQEYLIFHNTITTVMTKYENNHAEQDKLKAKLTSQKKQILQMIEQTIGVEKSANTTDFYDHLALFLRSKEPVNKTDGFVEDFRNTIEDNSVLKDIKVSSKAVDKKLSQRVSHAFKSGAVNRFFRDHVFGLLAAASVALPLAFFLFGPGALPLIGITVGVIATAFIVHKVCEYKAKQRLEKAQEKETNLPMIEKIIKLQAKNQQLQQLEFNSEVTSVVVENKAEKEEEKWKRERTSNSSTDSAKVSLLRSSFSCNQEEKAASSSIVGDINPDRHIITNPVTA